MRKKKTPEIIEFGSAELQAADTYLRAKREESTAEKEKKAAKAVLETALGECNIGVLPDGRKVIRNVNEFPEGDFHRNAYRTSTLVIG